MKKINELIRLITDKSSREDGITAEQRPARTEPISRYNAAPAGDERSYSGIDPRASEAARRLWCNAEHF